MEIFKCTLIELPVVDLRNTSPLKYCRATLSHPERIRFIRDSYSCSIRLPPLPLIPLPALPDFPASIDSFKRTRDGRNHRRHGKSVQEVREATADPGGVPAETRRNSPEPAPKVDGTRRDIAMPLEDHFAGS